jgi:sugar-phosphatase
MEIIAAVLRTIGLTDDFDVLQSAEHEPYGKPHPAVYIECARSLGIAPANCLALEDSPAGVLAAKAAKMTCIAIPPHELRDDQRYCIADLQLDSIEQFSAETVTALDRD